MQHKLTKFCMFCGNPPNNKNMEHVIPKWLWSMTGGFNRSAKFYGKQNRAVLSFVFPACTACNSKYGTGLESSAMRTVKAMLSSRPLEQDDISRLLDWFDKLRIGLWLSSLQLSSNKFGIYPKFHIDDRIGQKDRILLIDWANDGWQGLAWSGVDTFQFHCMPCCFGLRVNQLVFTNVSLEWLTSKRLGFPNPRMAIKINDEYNYAFVIQPGTGVLRTVGEKLQPTKSTTLLAQSIGKAGGPHLASLLSQNANTTYSPIADGWQSRVFIQKLGQIRSYPNFQTRRWIPFDLVSGDVAKSIMTDRVIHIQKVLDLQAEETHRQAVDLRTPGNNNRF